MFWLILPSLSVALGTAKAARKPGGGAPSEALAGTVSSWADCTKTEVILNEANTQPPVVRYMGSARSRFALPVFLYHRHNHV
jgi:hypothetical protein